MTEHKKPTVDDTSDHEKLLRERNEYLEGWKRARADFENLKKDADARLIELLHYKIGDLGHQILPIIELYEQALAHIPEPLRKENWFIGLQHIESQWKTFLKENNIHEIESTDAEFDPELHEAVEQTYDGTKGENIVLKTISKGYTLNGKLIKPAKVIVNIKN